MAYILCYLHTYLEKMAVRSWLPAVPLVQICTIVALGRKCLCHCRESCVVAVERERESNPSISGCSIAPGIQLLGPSRWMEQDVPARAMFSYFVLFKLTS